MVFAETSSGSQTHLREEQQKVRLVENFPLHASERFVIFCLLSVLFLLLLFLVFSHLLYYQSY